MKADCHMHMVLDGENWKTAIDAHRNGPAMALIHSRLRAYADAGFTYLRDGGDRWGVGRAAREAARDYGITYRTPYANLCKAGHYGGFIGETYADLREYARMVQALRRDGGDFVKIMISGLMDFDCCGRLTEAPLDENEIRELIRIAHEEGFSVMAHANGPRTVECAAEAGLDSAEHGAYLDEAALKAMVKQGTVWCPTVSALANLRGRGRFDEAAVCAIFDTAARNIRAFVDMGGILAPGSDAGAWSVPHVSGSQDEYVHLQTILGDRAADVLDRGIKAIMAKF